MTPDMILDLFKNGILLVVVISLVIIVPGLMIGLCVAMFQAATQINEATLNFLPKLMITLFALLLTAPWLLKLLLNYTQNLIKEIPYLIS